MTNYRVKNVLSINNNTREDCDIAEVPWFKEKVPVDIRMLDLHSGPPASCWAEMVIATFTSTEVLTVRVVCTKYPYW